MKELVRIFNGEIVHAIYGGKVKVCGRTLYNPTEQTYRDMGFGELPSCDVPEGHHVEYYIEDGQIKARAVEDEQSPLRRRFSKQELVNALKALGFYDTAKGVYAADTDLQIAYATFDSIDVDSDDAQAIIEKYPQLFSEDNINAILDYITYGRGAQ